MIDDEERWKTYITESLIETSISKDILMLTRVDKPALMKRLFELGCLYSGQILSYTKVLGQLQDAGNTTTLSHYLELLDTAGLLAGVEKYAPDVIRQRSSSPKFQVHNTALISAQRNDLSKDTTAKPDEWGRMVESAIGAHLINHSFTEKFNLHFVQEIINNAPPHRQQITKRTIQTITANTPDFVTIGRGGFKGYIIFGFTGRNTYILESLYTGMQPMY